MSGREDVDDVEDVDGVCFFYMPKDPWDWYTCLHLVDLCGK